MINSADHLFIHMLAICMPSSVKGLVESLPIFEIRLLIFLLLSYRTSLHILEFNPLLDIQFSNILSHSIVVFCFPLCSLFLLLGRRFLV